jgi:DNA invertase Pin-like site-specific DNA recombinase
VPWAEVPFTNKHLMCATVHLLLSRGVIVPGENQRRGTWTPSCIAAYTVDQTQGTSLTNQRDTCLAELARRDWTPALIVSEHASGKNVERPQLLHALDRLADGEFGALIVSRLDRLSRSVGDFAMLMDRAAKEGWTLVCLSPLVDMSDPYGRAMAHMAAAFAQLERELISQRQKESVAARKAAGTYVGGRKRMIDELTTARIVSLHRSGHGLAEICRRLTYEGYEPPMSDRWHSETLKRVLVREGERSQTT